MMDLMKHYGEVFPKADVMLISALHNFNVDVLLGRVIEMLPEHPAYYPKDVLSDRHLRFFVSEMIREQIFYLFEKEIPYHSEVIIEYYKEDENIPKIGATIFVSRESQKRILIGHGGSSVKKLGVQSRKSIEEFLGQHVFLDLNVKVKDWRDDETTLKQMGF
jgi:GTP-binding protein Era